MTNGLAYFASNYNPPKIMCFSGRSEFVPGSMSYEIYIERGMVIYVGDVPILSDSSLAQFDDFPKKEDTISSCGNWYFSVPQYGIDGLVPMYAARIPVDAKKIDELFSLYEKLDKTDRDTYAEARQMRKMSSLFTSHREIKVASPAMNIRLKMAELCEEIFFKNNPHVQSSYWTQH